MQAIAILALLGSALLIRQVVAGRVADTPTDLRDIFTSVITGDFNGLGDVLSRQSDSLGAAGSVASAAPGVVSLPSTAGGRAILYETVALGHAAKGYRRGGTGPDYYDCSGLVWQALKNTGAYTGPRFTTSNFVKALGTRITQVPSPAPGDIVLWPGHHMGVYGTIPQVFSAMSPSNGIGYQTIADLSSSIGSQPVYYRIVG